jgi:hypothetical protein
MAKRNRDELVRVGEVDQVAPVRENKTRFVSKFFHARFERHYGMVFERKGNPFPLRFQEKGK